MASEICLAAWAEAAVREPAVCHSVSWVVCLVALPEVDVEEGALDITPSRDSTSNDKTQIK